MINVSTTNVINVDFSEVPSLIQYWKGWYLNPYEEFMLKNQERNTNILSDYWNEAFRRIC